MSVREDLTAQSLVTRAEEMVELLRERGAEIDRLGVVPDDVLEALDAAGMYRFDVPKEHGGLAPVSASARIGMFFALGRGNGSVAWAVAAGESGVMIAGMDEAALAEVWGSDHVGPLTAGSTANLDLARGIGERVDGGFMVHGSWTFSSGIRRAAWLVAGINVVEDGQNVRYNALVPRGQFKVADDWHVTGMRGSASNSAYITEPVFVPEHRTMRWGGDDDGRDSAFLGSVVELAAIFAGMAQGAVEVFVDYAKCKASFEGAYRTLSEEPHVHSVLGHAKARIDHALCTVRYWAGRLDATDSEELTPEDVAQMSLVTMFAMHQVRPIPNEMCDLLGSSTARSDHPLGRFARDMSTLGLAFRLGSLEDIGRQVAGIERGDGDWLGAINSSLEEMPQPRTDLVELIEPGQELDLASEGEGRR